MTRKYAISARGKNIDLREMDRDEVIELKDTLIDSLIDIKSQISNAKRRVYTDGVYADPDWFYRAEKARRHVGKTVLKINRWLGKMKKDGLKDAGQINGGEYHKENQKCFLAE